MAAKDGVGCKIRKACAILSRSSGPAQELPEVLCPRCHPFHGCSLCHSVFYGQVGPIKHLPLLGGDFLLTPVGFGSGPCSKSGADIYKLRGESAGILDPVPKNRHKKCTNKIFMK